jgi:hypothetical protein
MSTASAYHTVKAALDMFEAPATTNEQPPSRQILQQAAERLKGEAAKGVA